MFKGLTDQFELIFGVKTPVRFLHLEKIFLKYTHPSPIDIASLSLAAAEGSLPNLKMLILSYNRLTNYVGNLFEHTGFPCLEQLNLSETQLNKNDMKSLGLALQMGKAATTQMS